MATTSTYRQTVSPIDALWSLYQSQSKRVRKAFRMRLLAEDIIDKKQAEMQEYENKLDPEVRHSLSVMAESVKQGVEDINRAAANNTHIGRKAEEFLAELDND